MKPELIEHLKQRAEFELARNDRAEPPDFPAFPEMPAARYTDPRFYDLELKQLFAKQWLFAGVTTELPDVGSYKLWKRSGVNVVLVRGKDQKIRAFYDTCRHRGASVVQGETGKARVLTCNFHCWTYDLEGQLRGVPAKHEFPNFEKSQHNLVPLRCEQWGNLIFVNRDMKAKSLAEHLGRAGREHDYMDFDKRKYVKTLCVDLNCNWKVAIDAFQEGYHLFHTHKNTVNPFWESHGLVLRLWPNGHSFMLCPAKPDRPTWMMEISSHDSRHELTRGTQTTTTIFPNTIFTLAEFMMPIFTWWPTGLNTCQFEVTVITVGEVDEKAHKDADTLLQQLTAVLKEDISNMEPMQKSLEAGLVKTIPLGCQERRIYWLHQEIDRQIGIDRIPPELRIQPVIEERHIET